LCIYKNYFAKFGQLIVREIVKIIAIRCQILRSTCTKIDFGWALLPRPHWGSLQRSHIPSSWNKGTLQREMCWKGRGEGKGKGRRRGEGMVRKWRGPVCMYF